MPFFRKGKIPKSIMLPKFDNAFEHQFKFETAYKSLKAVETNLKTLNVVLIGDIKYENKNACGIF